MVTSFVDIKKFYYVVLKIGVIATKLENVALKSNILNVKLFNFVLKRKSYDGVKIYYEIL